MDTWLIPSLNVPWGPQPPARPQTPRPGCAQRPACRCSQEPRGQHFTAVRWPAFKRLLGSLIKTREPGFMDILSASMSHFQRQVRPECDRTGGHRCRVGSAQGEPGSWHLRSDRGPVAPGPHTGTRAGKGLKSQGAMASGRRRGRAPGAHVSEKDPGPGLLLFPPPRSPAVHGASWLRQACLRGPRTAQTTQRPAQDKWIPCLSRCSPGTRCTSGWRSWGETNRSAEPASEVSLAAAGAGRREGADCPGNVTGSQHTGQPI